MTYAETLLCEEPIRPNPELTAVDESLGAIKLAEFAMDGICRYSFAWPRNEPTFGSASLDLIEAIRAATPLKQLTLVAGWRHEMPAELRLRHRYLVSKLTANGWLVHSQPELGLAQKDILPGGLHDAANFLRSSGNVGWFLRVEAKAKSPAELARPPFEATIRLFCWSHRLQPSEPFLLRLREEGSGILYVVDHDMGTPRLVLVWPNTLRAQVSVLAKQVRE